MVHHHTFSAFANDLSLVADEAVGVLQTYIQFDTTNPPGASKDAANWLADYLMEEGILAVVEESVPGRHNVIARLPGRGNAAPILLVHHLDVVPADASGWKYPPFGGTLVDGDIWGRGALDGKGPGIMSVAALIALRRSGLTLNRDIVLIAVTDEETGGEQGMKALLELHPEWKQAQWALMLDGSFALPFQGLKLFPVGVAEKASVALRLRLEGTGGHASLPMAVQPVITLAEAMHRLASAHLPYRIGQDVIDMFQRLGKKMGGLQGWLMQRIHWAIVQRLLIPTLSKNPMLLAMLRNTVSWTGMIAGEKYNIIPSTAEAMLDMRILPGTTPEQAMEWIKFTLDLPHVHVDVLEFKNPSRTPDSTTFVDLYSDAISDQDPDALAVPILTPFASDARHSRPFGIPTFVAVPAFVNNDLLGTIHGADERIPVTALKEGIERLFRLLVAAAT